MSSFNVHDYPKRSTGTANVEPRNQNKLLLKDMLFAGVQAVGGAALAVYINKNSASRIWPPVYSVIALGGAYNVIKNIRKIFWRSVSNEEDESCSVNNVATGTIIYFGSLYAFSEAWRSDHNLWIPCFGSAALGLYYAASSTYSKKTVSTMKPLLKCCQLSFEPALIVGGATYLLYFRNHEEEEWVYWLSLVAIGYAGLKFSIRGMYTRDEGQANILLLKAIELLMGGCFLTVSSTILAIYVSEKESWYESWDSYITATEIFGFFVIFIAFGVFFIFGSIICFQHYFGMDRQVAVCIGRMIRAPIVFFFACLIVKCMIHKRVAYTIFSCLSGWVLAVLWDSVRELHRIVPRPVFVRYCRRVLGPLLTVGSSAASAYIVYHFGFDSHYTRLVMPLVPYGIYVTYKGFSRMDRS